MEGKCVSGMLPPSLWYQLPKQLPDGMAKRHRQKKKSLEKCIISWHEKAVKKKILCDLYISVCKRKHIYVCIIYIEEEERRRKVKRRKENVKENMEEMGKEGKGGVASCISWKKKKIYLCQENAAISLPKRHCFSSSCLQAWQSWRRRISLREEGKEEAEEEGKHL